MKRYLILLLIVTGFIAANSQENYQLVKVLIPDKIAFEKLVASGIDLEGAIGKVGDAFEVVVSENDLSMLRQQGFEVLIQIDDISKFYTQRLYVGKYNALGFGYGSMGGYYTYTEILQQLDSMKLLYPSLITSKQVIGSTIQGRSIYAVKISDNPDVNEVTEPAVLYTALTHSREPQGMMTVLYYMWWLLQNYGTDPEATHLINNRQIWFIPIISADGYVYNQVTYPNGGGMWRKNRRLNSDGSYGVDLNRNFGPYEYWNAPNGGSSTIPSSDTYRGTAPFSEPEDATIRDFIAGRNIKACLNYHTYSNLLVYPYGALVHETPDSLIYREYAKDMTTFNGYVYGTDQQTVGYSTRGNSDDFMYDGDLINNGKIFAMTPEVGSVSDGFWPATIRIFPLAQENLYPNRYLSNVVGSYPVLQQRTVVDSSGDGFTDRGEKFYIKFTMRNKGLEAANNVSLQLSSSNPGIQVPTTPINFGDINSLSNKIDSAQCSIAALAQNGTSAQIIAAITDQSGRILYDTIPILIGKKIVKLVFSDSASNGTSNWNLGTSWGLSSDNNTPPSSFTDSPTGQYSSNTDNNMTLNTSLILSGGTEVKLKFWTKWAIETRWDFATVEASSNGGATWSTLQGKYTKPASGSGTQTPGTFGYDGTQSTWVEEEIDITRFISTQFKFRFRLRSDGSITADGFYVDDITLLILMPDTTKYRDVTISQVSVSFGNIPINGDSNTTITIDNFASSNDALSGSAALLYSTQFNLVNSSNFEVPAGESYQLFLSFIPNSEGAHNDTLIINHNATSIVSPFKIPLFGIAHHSPQFLMKICVKNAIDDGELFFGEIVGATNGLDTSLGEVELEPLLLPDSFDARWSIDGTNGAFLDLRDTLVNSNSINIFECTFQAGTNGYPVIISWDSDSSPKGLFLLKDALTAGSLISINMKNEDSTVISDTSINVVLIEHYIPPSVNINVNSGWNIVSLPSAVENPRKTVVFPTSSSNAFTFDGTYYPRDTLRRHEGYWIKYNSSQQLQIAGYEVLNDTLDVIRGWNLIGSISKPVYIRDIVTEPVDIIASEFYGYDIGYKAVQAIMPGHGYWVKVKQTGKLILNMSN